MNQLIGLILILVGVGLVATRQWSAEFHEKWNRQFAWTRWATGPKAMAASRIANVVVGIGFIIFGLTLLSLWR